MILIHNLITFPTITNSISETLYAVNMTIVHLKFGIFTVAVFSTLQDDHYRYFAFVFIPFGVDLRSSASFTSRHES